VHKPCQQFARPPPIATIHRNKGPKYLVEAQS
jgi:hypothetical protein